MPDTTTFEDRLESRRSVIIAVIVMVVFGLSFPQRYLLGPKWLPAVAGGLMLLVELLPVRWREHEGGRVTRPRVLAVAVIAIAFAINVYFLGSLIDRMVMPDSPVKGLLLVRSAVLIWLNNIVLFAIWYWHVDRGGREGRAEHPDAAPDFAFPPPAEASWMPTFPDYLFLAFNTATAFSPTDTLPLTHRTKFLMMIESATSLVTIAIVAARGVNIL